jgi:hypothetical protein
VPASNPPKDLLVLVADKNMEAGLTGILKQPRRLRIRSIEFDIRVLGNDPLVYGTSHKFLRDLQRLASYSIVVFDRHGCGSLDAREQLESDLELRLSQNGWGHRSAAIAIDPELENWVWSDSPHVAAELGWRHEELQRWLVDCGYRSSDSLKPSQPKEAVKHALQLKKRPRSSAIYRKIADHVSFDRCVDPAFTKLKMTLQSWFAQPEQ